MVFEIDPDQPQIPALARILSGMGMLCLIGSVVSALLAFSKYTWVNETLVMCGAVGAFLLALLFIGQAKILELLAVVSARVKSRFAIEGLALHRHAAAAPAPAEPKLPVLPTTASKERVIHVPDDQARQQGFKVR